MNTLAVSTTRAGKALTFFKTTLGPLLLVIAGMGALYALMPSGKDEVDNLTTGFDGLGQSISYSKEMYESMADELSSGTIAGALEQRAQQENKVSDLRKSLEVITEPKLLKIRQAELDVAERELAVLKDITTERQAQQFILSEQDAQGFFEQAKLTQSLEQDMLSELENNKIFGTVATGFLGDLAVDVLGVDDRLPNVFYSDASTKAVQEYNEAIDSIPEHLKGVVMEAAYASSSFEEFMSAINQMADSEGFENPF